MAILINESVILNKLNLEIWCTLNFTPTHFGLDHLYNVFMVWVRMVAPISCFYMFCLRFHRKAPTASSKVPWHIIIIPTLWYPCFFATAARSGLGEFAVLYTSASFMRNPTHVFFTWFHAPSAGMWGCANVSVLAHIFDILFDAMLHTASSHDFTYLPVAWGVW